MRYHTTADGDVPFTSEEEAERDAEEATAKLEQPKSIIRAQIVDLESSITERMKREVLLGISTINLKTGKTAKEDIQDINDQIAILRTQI